MSRVTDGFLKRANEAGNIELVRLIVEIYDHAVSLEQMLRKHEWTNGTNEHCPECDAWEATGSHAPDCAIAKLLE